MEYRLPQLPEKPFELSDICPYTRETADGLNHQIKGLRKQLKKSEKKCAQLREERDNLIGEKYVKANTAESLQQRNSRQFMTLLKAGSICRQLIEAWDKGDPMDGILAELAELLGVDEEDELL